MVRNTNNLNKNTPKQVAAAVKVQTNKKIITWMLLSLLGLGTLLIATQLYAEEVNLYQKNYKAQNEGNLVSLQANPDTKMYVSNHKDDDNISMLEKGYDMMGTSGFEAGDVAADAALQHAKAIKADTVLVYSKYGSAKTPASKIQMIKEAAKKGGGEIDAKDLQDEGILYNYYASYWAKLPNPLLGVHVIKLVSKGQNEDNPDETMIVPGLNVVAVIKDSPADKAGIKRGDMLLKINNVELNKAEELSAIVRKLQGKTVDIDYDRDGEMVNVKAALNKR